MTLLCKDVCVWETAYKHLSDESIATAKLISALTSFFNELRKHSYQGPTWMRPYTKDLVEALAKYEDDLKDLRA